MMISSIIRDDLPVKETWKLVCEAYDEEYTKRDELEIYTITDSLIRERITPEEHEELLSLIKVDNPTKEQLRFNFKLSFNE